MIVEIIEDQRF